MNDLDASSGDSKVTKFADAKSLINAWNIKGFSIQEYIKSVSNWLVSIKLTLNAAKCELMLFGSGNPQLLKIQKNPQKDKNSCKKLGAHLGKYLQFHQHIKYGVTKPYQFCRPIYSCHHLNPCKYLLLFYHSFAKSIKTYGILIYGSAAKISLGKIEIGQHRILRANFFKTKFDQLTHILFDNGILTVFELYLTASLREFLQPLRHEVPEQYLFEIKDDNSSSKA